MAEQTSIPGSPYQATTGAMPQQPAVPPAPAAQPSAQPDKAATTPQVNLHDLPQFRQVQSQYEKQLAAERERRVQAEMKGLDDFEKLQYENQTLREQVAANEAQMQAAQMEALKQRTLAEIASMTGAPLEVMAQATDPDEAWRAAVLYMRTAPVQQAPPPPQAPSQVQQPVTPVSPWSQQTPMTPSVPATAWMPDVGGTAAVNASERFESEIAEAMRRGDPAAYVRAIRQQGLYIPREYQTMPTGTRTSLSDSNLIPRAVSDVVFMIDWMEAPLLRLLGFGNENTRKFNLLNWPSTKAEIIEDTMSPFASALAESGFDDTEVDLTVTTTHGVYFRQGDIIRLESEQMLVTAVTGDVLTVVRGHGGTTAAAHADTTAIALLTRAMPEGSAPVTGHTTTTTSPYNYSQIISEAVTVTRTAQAINMYGVDDIMNYSVAKLFADGGRAGRLAQFLQRTFYYGKRVIRAASPAYGFMGGFDTFVTTNVTPLAGAPLQRSNIHKSIRDVMDAGGKVTHLVTGSWGIEKITAMYEGMITMTQDQQRGGSKITTIMTPHGQVEVVFDWMCPAGYAYLLNKDKVGWIPLRPFTTSKIMDEGDYFTTDVVGEFTFMVSNERSHAIISGFSTTA